MKATSKKMFETRNDLPQRTREAMVNLLNQQLADTFDLFSQVKQAHWNVKGLHFMPLHLLFDEFAAALSEQADTIAERATALGGMAMGTVRMAAAQSTLPEFPAEQVKDKEVVTLLANRYGNYAASTRAAISAASDCEDESTMDLFVEISRLIDKHLWFLEAHLTELAANEK